MPEAGYTFGPFLLDLEACELRRGDAKLPLRPKCFDLLLYLLRHRGKLVPKETLLQEIWSDAVVSEATLTRTVAALREQLEDNADDPEFIATVSRRGYKFIASAEELQGEKERPKESEFMLVHGATEYPLRKGTQTIGRGREAEIPLYNALTSRQHARIRVDGQTVMLEDLGSRNGTYVNGRKVAGSIPLRPGDQIRIGNEVLILWSPTSDTFPGAM